MESCLMCPGIQYINYFSLWAQPPYWTQYTPRTGHSSHTHSCHGCDCPVICLVAPLTFVCPSATVTALCISAPQSWLDNCSFFFQSCAFSFSFSLSRLDMIWIRRKSPTENEFPNLWPLVCVFPSQRSSINSFWNSRKEVECHSALTPNQLLLKALSGNKAGCKLFLESV